MPTKAIMASARGETCSVRIPGVCCHNNDTVVLAHLNKTRFGKGAGHKAFFGAYACHSCHAVLDGGKRPNGLEKEQVYMAHLEGCLETLMRLIDKGLAVLK